MPGPLREEPPRMVSFAKRKELASDLKALFAAPEREMALGLAASVAGKWRGKGREKVAEHVEEHVEECLSCLGPSPSPTAGASAPRMGKRGSTRR